MQYIVILGIFGAFCLTIGYSVGIAKAEIIKKQTLRLIKRLNRAQEHLEKLHQEVLRDFAACGYEMDAEQMDPFGDR